MSTSHSFSQFNLNSFILSALTELGYETATPVQEQGIPILLQGDDLLAQAQTGTGKTATFALPILSRLDLSIKSPQALVIAPTRELAIQVAEAFQSYAKHMRGFLVAPIYGGQDFGTQLRLLKRGSQVIVGTPGRLMDHLRRGSLPVEHIKTIVLDEADEMLKMGFVDDVEWILSQLTGPHQTALFSATLPASIQKIAQKYLKNAKKVQVQAHNATVDAIDQSYITVNREQKLELLTRILEAEETNGVIIFARTKNDSADLAQKLQARGFTAAALNGDMSQGAREKTVAQLKKGALDIVVATDVAARGIDVERVSHVINYDIPYDVDSYVHRIGRTGRAGRTGSAILFVTPREQRLFRDIEHHIKKTIKRMEPPTLKSIREKQFAQLQEKIVTAVREKKSELAAALEQVNLVSRDNNISTAEIAAAMIVLNQTALPANDVLAETSKAEFSSNRERKNDRYNSHGDGRSRGSRDRNFRGGRSGGGDRKFGDRKFGDRKFEDRKFEDRKPGERKFDDKKFSGEKKFSDRDQNRDHKKFRDEKFSGEKRSDDRKPRDGEKHREFKPNRDDRNRDAKPNRDADKTRNYKTRDERNDEAKRGDRFRPRSNDDAPRGKFRSKDSDKRHR